MNRQQFFEALASIKGNGWVVDNDGFIRCKRGDCPLLAVLKEKNPEKYAEFLQEEAPSLVHPNLGGINGYWGPAARDLGLNLSTEEAIETNDYIEAVDGWVHDPEVYFNTFEKKRMERLRDLRLDTLKALGLNEKLLYRRT